MSRWSGEGFLWHCGVDTYAIKRMGQKISLHHNSVRHKWPSVRCNPDFHFASISHNFLTRSNQIKSTITSFFLSVCYIICSACQLWRRRRVNRWLDSWKVWYSKYCLLAWLTLWLCRLTFEPLYFRFILYVLLVMITLINILLWTKQKISWHKVFQYAN